MRVCVFSVILDSRKSRLNEEALQAEERKSLVHLITVLFYSNIIMIGFEVLTSGLLFKKNDLRGSGWCRNNTSVLNLPWEYFYRV